MPSKTRSGEEQDQENDGLDQLPSLFPDEISKDVKCFTLKAWHKPRLLMKKIARELRTSSSVIIRGMDEQVEKCIICTEMLKSWLSEKPIYKGSDCSKVYQWNKIGEVRIKPENKLEVDRYSPVLEIILSLQPFEEGQFNDSMQTSTSIELSPSRYGREDTGFQFEPLRRPATEPVGAENPQNIFRRKRKIGQ